MNDTTNNLEDRAWSAFELSDRAFEAVIFDCDGTLADTACIHYRAFRNALSEQDIALPADWYGERTGYSRAMIFDAIRADFHVKFDDAAIAHRAEQLYVDMIDDVAPVDPVAAIARRLYGSVPIAVASAGQRKIVEATLRSIGIEGLFDQIVTVEDVPHGKPEPDLFLLAAKKLGVAPRACLVFEDSDEGMEAAKRADMEAIDVRPVLTRTPEWQKRSFS